MELDEYVTLDAVALGNLVRNKIISPSELAKLANTATNIVNKKLNAAVEIFETPIIDNNIPLSSVFSGVPCFKKDLGTVIAGYGYESGSRLTTGIKSPITDEFSKRMLTSGLQLLGRSTSSEFGSSISTETAVNGSTRNPWDVDRSAGGSSGGSAALVAAGAVPIAHTNDGGGSSRIPASMCGNVGLKTSRGLVSQAPNANELTSPLTSELCNSRTVRDTAAFLDIVSANNKGEATFKGMHRNTSFLKQLNSAPRKYRIAYSCDAWGASPMAPHARSEVERIATLLVELGHNVEEVTPTALVNGKYWQHFQTIIYCFMYLQIDFWADLLGRDPSIDNLEPITLQVYEAGSNISIKQHAQAWSYINHIARKLGTFFQNYDLLLTPTVNHITPPIGSDLTSSSNLNLESWFELMRKYIPQTPIANLTGIPAISVPVASWKNDLPLGMQFFGAMGSDAALLDIARQLEIAQPWKSKRPNIFAAISDI
ncbi:hypothetical protein A9Q81_22095 [Gammaproteobacteria bacterium 42_54_T18]|nr:hypothetical protein A9Q81_22095 [Gammaproteobacteria bacterium 42_54_T18]